jgi:hypothetical protein
MSNTPKQHKIIAEVEISCALNTMSINDGIEIYNANGLENVSKGIKVYVKATRDRLLEGKPGHFKVAGTNAKAMFEVLFKLDNEQYILNFISALKQEQKLRKNPNGEVAKAINNAKETLLKK